MAIHGRGAWTSVGMPDNGSAFYAYITPKNVGSEVSRGDAYRAVNFGVKVIQTRINEMRATPAPVNALLSEAEHASLSPGHRDQWVQTLTPCNERGWAPKPGVVPFVTVAEYNAFGANKNWFSPYRTAGGANGFEPTTLMIPSMAVDGVFGLGTSNWVKWAQKILGLNPDGQVGQTTMKTLLLPYVNSLSSYSITIRHAIAAICSHESGFDPGAVGYTVPDDIGLVQINGPANPGMSEAQRFEYHVAYKYCGDRLTNALGTYHDMTYAVADYYSPLWAQQWAKTGTAPNSLISDFVNYVLNWTP